MNDHSKPDLPCKKPPVSPVGLVRLVDVRISQLCFFPQRLLTGDLQFDFQETVAKRISASRRSKRWDRTEKTGEALQHVCRYLAKKTYNQNTWMTVEAPFYHI